MKLVRFESGLQVRYGVWEDDIVKEVTGSIYGDFRISSTTHRIGDVRLLAPAEPTKILCVGLNFRDHIEEIGLPTPKCPAHFLKPLTTLIGPEDPIVIPAGRRTGGLRGGAGRGDQAADQGRLAGGGIASHPGLHLPERRHRAAAQHRAGATHPLQGLRYLRSGGSMYCHRPRPRHPGPPDTPERPADAGGQALRT